MKTAQKLKQVKLDLTSIDSNAFMLIGAFRRQAKKEGWTEAEITAVTDKCMSGNYENLVATLVAHCW